MADRADLEFTYSLIDRIFRLSLGELADFSGAKREAWGPRGGAWGDPPEPELSLDPPIGWVGEVELTGLPG